MCVFVRKNFKRIRKWKKWIYSQSKDGLLSFMFSPAAKKNESKKYFCCQ